MPYLLAGSSISMGGIGIWCMHYVANRAIILSAAGDAAGQISYNAGYTTLSFFVPIFVLLAAFSLLGTNEITSKIRIGVSGTLAGLAICGMHYLGQAGISNYDCIYEVPNVVGAAIIAVAASIVALAVFFALRASWTNSWWKRATCATVLAGAVSGMHWTAALGTHYRFRAKVVGSQQNLTAKETVTMVIILSIVACALLLGLAMIAQHRRAEQANRAQQVVLACATFDPKGRLMVSPEGLIPSQKITGAYLEQSFDDVFCTSHPVFLWIYRVTRNWRGVADLIPSMKDHVRTITVTKPSRPRSQASLQSLDPSYSHGTIGDYSAIFRELFCVSASALAGQINQPLEKIGVLYGEILSTGVTARSTRQIFKSTKDVESGSPAPYIAFGRGQLLFVVRSASTVEAAELQANGYRFAEVQSVADILAGSMQVEREELQKHIGNMRASAMDEPILEPGVHLACFAIRACVKGGFDVLVRKDAKNLLPAVQLPIPRLSQTELDIVQSLEGASVATCLTTLRNKRTVSGEAIHIFVTQFYNALTALVDEVAEPFFQEATLISKPILAPCRGAGPQPTPGKTALITFRKIVPIQSQMRSSQLVFSPLSLFNTQQHVYRNAPDHDVFARMIHREFAGILSKDTSSEDGQAGDHTPVRLNSPGRWANFRRSIHSSKGEKNHVDNQSLGGIMVSQSVIVDITEAESCKDMEMHALGTVGQAMRDEGEVVTFVNELLAACAADGQQDK